MRFTALPALEHDLVVLRPIEAADIQPWFDYLCLREVFEHTSWNVHAPEELAHNIWNPEAVTPSSPLRLAVARRSDDRLVGTAGFHTVAPQDRSAELAYDFSPSVWGQGIATAVCNGLVRWGHDEAGLQRVQATVLETNERSIRVLERCGFEREGLLRGYRLVRGKPGNFFMYAHLRG